MIWGEGSPRVNSSTDASEEGSGKEGDSLVFSGAWPVSSKKAGSRKSRRKGDRVRGHYAKSLESARDDDDEQHDPPADAPADPSKWSQIDGLRAAWADHDGRNALLAGIVAILPLIEVSIVMVLTNNFWLALFGMHAVMLLSMVLHVSMAGRAAYYRNFLEGQLSIFSWPHILWFLIWIAIGSFPIALFPLAEMLGFQKNWFRDRLLMTGVEGTTGGVLLSLGIYFTFINPLVEEPFWRLYIVKELGGYCFPAPHSSSSASPSSSPTMEQLHASQDLDSDISSIPSESRIKSRARRCVVLPNEQECNVVCLNSTSGNSPRLFHDVRLSELGNWICASLYGSYHLMIIHFMAGPPFGPIGAVGVTCIGRLLHYLRNTKQFGFLGALGFHIGVDLTCSLLILWVVGGLNHGGI